MKTVSTIAFAALIGVSTVTLISARASAGIVCNEEGDCWHAQRPSTNTSRHLA